MTDAARQESAPLVALPRIRHGYAGAEWIEKNLAAQRRIDARSKRARRLTTASHMSELGKAVADVLGLVWQGIYHLDEAALMRVRWDDQYLVEVPVRHGLATFDRGDLTWLVIVCHDLMLRMEIDVHRPGHLLLRFWQRRQREGSLFERMPTLEQHAETLRRAYQIVTEPGGSAP